MRFLLCMLAACLLSPCTASPAEFPAPTGYVSDFAGVMRPETISQLDGVLASLKDKTGAEIAVVTVKTLGDLDIETYAARLVKEWGIGSKERNDGVLILVSTGDRRVRIEVGYGLEPLITDAKSGMIRDQYLTPKLRVNDYDGGLKDGALAIAALISAEKGVDIGAGAPPQARRVPVRRSSPGGGPLLNIIIVIAILLLFGRGRSGSCLSGLLLGSLLGGGGRRNYGGIGGFGGGFGGGGIGGGFGGGGGGFGGFGGGFSGGGGASGGF
jgi:uncharacterized protein